MRAPLRVSGGRERRQCAVEGILRVQDIECNRGKAGLPGALDIAGLVVDEDAGTGGQVQRTAAARMFVVDPELLVFDDLSSALDVETEKVLWQRIFAGGQS